MLRMRTFAIILILGVLAGAGRAAETYAPTHADLAVFVAKGLFRDHVPGDASLKDCVAFLNANGICFSFFDILDRKSIVSKEDVARVMGQADVLFLGEAEVVNGCVSRPMGAKSWVDYCLLNDITYSPVFKKLKECTEGGPLPEVQRFFGN